MKIFVYIFCALFISGCQVTVEEKKRTGYVADTSYETKSDTGYETDSTYDGPPDDTYEDTYDKNEDYYDNGHKKHKYHKKNYKKNNDYNDDYDNDDYNDDYKKSHHNDGYQDKGNILITDWDVGGGNWLTPKAKIKAKVFGKWSQTLVLYGISSNGAATTLASESCQDGQEVFIKGEYSRGATKYLELSLVNNKGQVIATTRRNAD